MRAWRQGYIHPMLVAVTIFFILLPTIAAAQAPPASFDDLVSQATAAREQNDIPGAIQLYGQALQLNPKWQDGWWFLGSLQYATDSYAPARDALTHYLELVPNAVPALALRGLCEFEIGDYAPALNDIQRALSLGAANQSRNEKILRYHEALLLTCTGKFEEALQRYGVFVQHEAANPELLLAIGLAGLRTPVLPKELVANQRDLFVTAGNATFLFLKGDQKGAQQAFQALFQRFPSAPNAHYLYGYLLFPTDPDQAVAEFKRELEIAPSNANDQVMLAWASLTQNDPAEALPYAEKSAEEEPTLPSAQLVLGRSLLETGNLKDGIAHLETALKLEPDNLETHIALAKAYSKSGRKEDARRERLLCLQITQNRSTQIVSP